MADLELVGMGSPNVLKIVMMLEELELDWEFKYLNVYAGAHRSPELLAINPNAKLPLLIDRRIDGGLAIGESGAILIHLAEQAGRFLPADAARRAEVLTWTFVQMTGVGPFVGQYVHFLRFKPDELYALGRYRTETLRLLDVIDARLSTAEWFGGTEHSIADIALYPWAARFEALGFSLARRSGIARWMQSIEERPAFAAYHRHAETLWARNDADRSAATPDEIDRFTGRGRHGRLE